MEGKEELMYLLTLINNDLRELKEGIADVRRNITRLDTLYKAVKEQQIQNTYTLEKAQRDIDSVMSRLDVKKGFAKGITYKIVAVTTLLMFFGVYITYLESSDETPFYDFLKTKVFRIEKEDEEEPSGAFK